MTKNIKKILCLTLAIVCFLASFGASSTNASAKESKKFGAEYYFLNDRYNVPRCHYSVKNMPGSKPLEVKLGDYICFRFNEYTSYIENGPEKMYVKTSNKKIAEYKYVKKYDDHLIKTKKLGTTKITITGKWYSGKKRSRTYKIKVVPRINAKEADVSPELKKIAKDVLKGTKIKVMFTDDFPKDKFDVEESIIYLTSECKYDLTDFEVKKEDASIDARIKYTLYRYFVGENGFNESNLHSEERYEKSLPLVKNIKGFKIGKPYWRYTIEYKSSDDLDYFDMVQQTAN